MTRNGGEFPVVPLWEAQMQRIVLALLSVVFFGGCLPAPTDSGADSLLDSADPLLDSCDRYEKFENRMNTSGCYEFAGLIFCVVEQNVTRDKLQSAKIKAPHLAVALLRKSYLNLPQKITLKSNIVENGYDDTRRKHRYVIAYRLSEVKEILRQSTGEKL